MFFSLLGGAEQGKILAKKEICPLTVGGWVVHGVVILSVWVYKAATHTHTMTGLDFLVTGE